MLWPFIRIVFSRQFYWVVKKMGFDRKDKFNLYMLAYSESPEHWMYNCLYLRIYISASSNCHLLYYRSCLIRIPPRVYGSYIYSQNCIEGPLKKNLLYSFGFASSDHLSLLVTIISYLMTAHDSFDFNILLL